MPVPDGAVDDYIDGLTLAQVASKHGASISTARRWVKEAGRLRNIKEAIALSAYDRVAHGRRSGAYPMPPSAKQRLSVLAKQRAERSSKGWSVKPNGYVEFTRGPHKGRSVHVVKMEKLIKRRLLPNEVVHHIDHNKQNNQLSNLRLMTRADHTRLHRLERK